MTEIEKQKPGKPLQAIADPSPLLDNLRGLILQARQQVVRSVNAPQAREWHMREAKPAVIASRRRSNPVGRLQTAHPLPPRRIGLLRLRLAMTMFFG